MCLLPTQRCDAGIAARLLNRVSVCVPRRRIRHALRRLHSACGTLIARHRIAGSHYRMLLLLEAKLHAFSACFLTVSSLSTPPLLSLSPCLCGSIRSVFGRISRILCPHPIPAVRAWHRSHSASLSRCISWREREKGRASLARSCITCLINLE